MKTRLLLTIFFCLLPLRLSAQTADDIIKKTVEARGGIAKIKAVQSERITGRVAFPQGFEGMVILELERPHKLYSEMTVQGQKVLRAYDGKSAGWIVDPFGENKAVQAMPEEDLKGMPDEADPDGPMVDYKAKGSKIELAGKEDLDGKAVYHLKITDRQGEVRSYFLDASTFLTVKWTGLRKIDNQMLPWECTFSDYRDVGGLKFPFKIDQGSPGTEFRQSLTIEKVELNPKIEESHFAKPVLSPAPAAPAPSTPPLGEAGQAEARKRPAS